MSITVKDVEYIAELAKLELSEEEKRNFQKDLNQIVAYFEKLNELDTSAVEPLSHAREILNVMRKDRAKTSLPVDEALSNAPDRKGSFFKVPKVIH